jgi:hypothetical protein
MKNKPEQDVNIDGKWYYTIVQNPGSSAEQFVGYKDEKTGSQFLPVFKTKEHALKCFEHMPKDLFHSKYEAQAVIEDDLLQLVQEQNYKLYLLDGEGKILENEIGDRREETCRMC